MMQTAEIETARPVIRIVDDDEVFLASQKFFFETFFPEVRVWPCAERYLDEEDLSAPGCLILDYRMPDRSGLEVQRALLLRRKPMLPIIFLSAHGDIGTAVHAMRNGAVDFLEKPVEPEALLAKVRTAVAWSPMPLSVSMTAAAWSFRCCHSPEENVKSLILRSKECKTKKLRIFSASP